ncbi:MAG TPA: type II secretion system F family protein [Alphaproteobacteria bacterium]|nr:type II secretion system F family protein [Alphaproteobacteria bacterium]
MSGAPSALGGLLVPLVLGALASVVFLLAAVGLTGGERARIKRRLARVTAQPGAARDKAAKVNVRLDQSDSSIRGLDRLIKRYLPRPAQLRERLAKTGRRISLGEYVLVSLLVMSVVFFAFSSLLRFTAVASLLLAVAAGLWLPHAVVGIMIGRRLKAFTQLFPDAIDLIVRGLKSGLPVTESIKLVGQDLPDPIGVEFRSIAGALGIGQTLEQALWSAAARLDVAEFRFFAISLSVQKETGGNLAETLDNLATILRRRRQMRLKIKALSAEARASATIIGLLPFIMFGVLYALNPEYITVLLVDPRGRVMLGGALLSLLTGVGIMFKMARFEI